MTFKEWIYSDYTNNPSINGRWGLLHVITLILCVAIIIAIALFGKNNKKRSKIILIILASVILFFELSRRIINLSRGTSTEFTQILRILLPRPWCAISCWMLILCPIVNKKFWYNFTAISALLNAIIFFAYPSVGFNHKYILFENLYSIVTHALLLITSISLITLKFTDYNYSKSSYKVLVLYLCILAYAFIEIFILKIESDPLYFMSGNDIQDIFGFSYPIYLIVYIIFTIVWFNIPYLIQTFILPKIKNKRKKLA